MDKKSRDAFRTISEVADWLDTPTHVLRFWESRFTQVKPVKRAGGRRYYRPNDMLLIGGIKKLLHEDGMTIRGVQKLLREEGVKHVSAMSQPIDGHVDDALDDDTIDVEATVAEAPMAVDVEPQPELDNVVSLAQAGTTTEIADLDNADTADDAPRDVTSEEFAATAPPPAAQEDLPETDDTGADSFPPAGPLADDHVAQTPAAEKVDFDDALETVPMDDGQTLAALDDTPAEVTTGQTADTTEPPEHAQVDTDLAPAPVGAPDATALPPHDPNDAAPADMDETDDNGFDFNAPAPLLDEDDPSLSPHAEAPLSPAMDDAERPATDNKVEQGAKQGTEQGAEQEADLTHTAQDEPQSAPAVAQVDVPEDPDDDTDLGDTETPVIAALRAGAANHVPEDALERAMDKLRNLRARM